MTDKRIIVLVGPSGSGKTTIGDRLTKIGVPKLVTTTTRQPRPGEKDGKDYYFRKLEELDPADFIEQTIYSDRLYGLTKEEVKRTLAEHDLAHVSLDRNGVKAMRAVYPKETHIVFIQVSPKAMEERMRKRGDSEEKIRERIAHSEETGEFDPPEETNVVIENNDLQQTVEKIMHTVDFHQ